ncbi:radical SAM protein [Clostridium formicaceticum]|uniref:7-carboxy-7-deazaguanine synthase n=1 Tax=Clostridium formicaceticum TaxID=1497 RepID=A0AAC9RIZ7_9CLOT|nr:radical SAM protein [Clostridium formicaceticum]AOY75672.1 hypothetical protein BJL90_07050 [Clostridium formicaceticum]ARE85988.1 7-carboxy-7-deazaguanine synthase [Clostridium formicaceticum]
MSEKKKIILFGASDSGKDAYQRLKDKYDIVVFFDNNGAKQGEKFCDVPVVAPIPPQHFDAEFIVITSHQWKDIYEQLNRSLNIGDEKIRIGHALLEKSKLIRDITILQVDEADNGKINTDKFEIYWLLGYQCNYTCSYCFYKMKEKNVFKVSDDQLRNATNNIASLHNKKIKVDLVGGEPTIFPYYQQLIWDLEKLPNVEMIQTETNLSRSLKYFEELFSQTVNIEKLTFSASYHFEFAKQDEFIEKILLFNRYNVRIGITFMAHPDKLQEVKRFIDTCSIYETKSVAFQLAVVLDMGMPDPRYKKSDLEWINSVNDIFRKNSNKSDSGVCIKYQKDGGNIHEIKISPRRAIADGFNDFRNMQCMAGMDSIRINEKGDVFPAMCFWESSKDDFCRGKNIFNKDEQLYFDSPVICPFSCCLVPSDVRIKKR